MKIFLYIVIVFLSLSTYGQLIERVECTFLKRPNYIVNEESVYFENCYIHRKIDTNPKDFVVINELAYDKEHLFYNGKKLDIVPVTPELMGTSIYSNYWKNNGILYREDVKVCDLDQNTFELLGSDYIKNKNYIYYKGKLIKEIDASTFVVNILNYDKNSVYLNNKITIPKDSTFQSINGYFYKSNLHVYEYIRGRYREKSYMKLRSDIKIQNTKPILKTKYGILNDTLYYQEKATPYYHIDIDEIKFFSDELIGCQNKIILEGYTVEGLDYNSLEIIENGDYNIVKDNKGSYYLGINGGKVSLSPYVSAAKTQKPNYENLTKIEMSEDALVENNYPLVTKLFLKNGGITSFKDLSLVSILRGYRRGCSQDSESPSDYYILKNSQGYWRLTKGRNDTISYIGKKYYGSL